MLIGRGEMKGSFMTTNLRRHLLASTLLVGASALATPAWAQDAQPVITGQASAETAAQAPAKKPRKAIKKSETKSDSKAAAKKWDPDALFPH